MIIKGSALFDGADFGRRLQSQFRMAVKKSLIVPPLSNKALRNLIMFYVEGISVPTLGPAGAVQFLSDPEAEVCATSVVPFTGKAAIFRCSSEWFAGERTVRAEIKPGALILAATFECTKRCWLPAILASEEQAIRNRLVLLSDQLAEFKLAAARAAQKVADAYFMTST